LTSSQQLNDYLLPIYNSTEGRKVYDDTLHVVQSKFSQYVREIQGIADGAKVEFYKVREKKERYKVQVACIKK
jgi:SAM-dependent MidA family methyltransferase